MKNYKKLTALLTALVALAVTTANASLSQSQLSTAKKSLAGVAAAELPAKAAKIVAQTPGSEKEEMAVFITRTVLSKKPGMAVALVSAISAASPEVAPAVSAAAASVAKDLAEAVAFAAMKAAPNYTEQIGESVAKAAPASAEQVRLHARTAKSANVASVAGGITITPGAIATPGYNPAPVPPNPPAQSPVVGYDNKRYLAP